MNNEVNLREYPLILDTTLREGSYVVNFQFTDEDTWMIASRLDAAGVDLIEVGHGLGLGANKMISSNDKSFQPVSDHAYMEAAQAGVQKSSWGCFIIPGLGELSDIRDAAKQNIGFLRVGTDVSRAEESEPFIRLAKELGITVFSNLMKTYSVDPEDAASQALKVESYGADFVCVVDSAGGMFPNEVEMYVSEIRKRCSIPINFHGHNNLGMAISNSLAAFEAGATVIDTSLRGLGRSGGNAPTEMVMLALKRMGKGSSADILSVLDAAEAFIDPIIRRFPQIDSFTVTSGYSQFHSSSLARVLQVSSSLGVDPRHLIIELAGEGKESLSNEAISLAADRLPKSSPKSLGELLSSSDVFAPALTSSTGLADQASGMAKIARSKAHLRGVKSVFNIVQGLYPPTSSSVSQIVNEDSNAIVVSGEIYDEAGAAAIAKAIDGAVDFVLLDCDLKLPNSREILATVRRNLEVTKVIEYSDLRVWSKSVLRVVQLNSHKSVSETTVTLLGEGELRESVADVLYSCGVRSSVRDSDFTIFCGPPGESAELNLASSGVIDAWIGGIPKKDIWDLQKKGVPIFRPDMHGEIQAELSGFFYQEKRAARRNSLETKKPLMSFGGRIDPEGTVILDMNGYTTKVLGVADGFGRVIPIEAATREQQLGFWAVQSDILDQLSRQSYGND